jgi:hypothetical protein
MVAVTAGCLGMLLMLWISPAVIWLDVVDSTKMALLVEPIK